MNVEARIVALEERLAFLETKVKKMEPKLDHAHSAIVDVHDDVREIGAGLDRLERKFDGLKHDLPRIIAEAVAPLLSERD